MTKNRNVPTVKSGLTMNNRTSNANEKTHARITIPAIRLSFVMSLTAMFTHISFAFN
jgi:hypothetical protein